MTLGDDPDDTTAEGALGNGDRWSPGRRSFWSPPTQFRGRLWQRLWTSPSSLSHNTSPQPLLPFSQYPFLSFPTFHTIYILRNVSLYCVLSFARSPAVVCHQNFLRRFSHDNQLPLLLINHLTEYPCFPFPLLFYWHHRILLTNSIMHIFISH